MILSLLQRYNRFLPTVVEILLAVCVAVVLLTGCSGLFDGIYDSPVPDDAIEQGFVVQEGDGRYTLFLDARDYDEWMFVDLHRLTVESRPIPTELTGQWDGVSMWYRYNVQGTRYNLLEDRRVDAQEEPECWDFAIHHFDVRTNGGMVLATDYTSVDALPVCSADLPLGDFVPDRWTRHQCIVDFSGMFDRNIWYQASMVNTVLTEWVRMDFSTPPPKYEASRRVYILRMSDGTMAALHMKSYMSEAGTKGFLTIDIIYPY